VYEFPKKRGRGRTPKANWASGPEQFEYVPPAETEFEKTAKQLGLDHKADCEQLAKSTELRRWAERNVRQRFVPPELIEAWGLRAEWGGDEA
jgi:hypothetical protein